MRPLSSPPVRRFTSRSTVALAVVAALALSAAAAWAKKKKVEETPEEIDHVSLAARMIKDGHFDRAQAVLGQVDLKLPGLDLARYFTLLGLVKLKLEDHSGARDALVQAVKVGQQDRSVHLFLAQAYYGLKDDRSVIRALDDAGDELTSTAPELYGMRAVAHWRLGEHARAFAALAAGAQKFPAADKLQRQRVFYLVELGLFQEAIAAGEAYVNRATATPDDYITMGEALRRARQFQAARQFLEAARLRFPGDATMTAQLAHAYAQAEQENAAGFLFEQAAFLDEKFRVDAAEMYRRGGRLDLALALNAGVADQVAKMRQRLGILLKMERYDVVTTMEPRLSRLGLLDDQDIRYALAYAFYSVGDFAAAERHLKPLRDARLFEKAAELRKAMAACKERGWECS